MGFARPLKPGRLVEFVSAAVLSEAVARLVEAQWTEVRAYQAIDEAAAAALYADDLAREQTRASDSIERLDPWPGLPPKAEKAFTRGADLARLRRILDLVSPGDRVLEIGTGQGYMAGVLLRDRKLEHYCGVDINPRLIDAVQAMAPANDLDLSSHHVQVMDLFDLTPEFVAQHRPDVALLLEVVEHVDDPEAALRTVSSVLDDDTMLVFSVPLLGRIEACWGHLSLFDDRRVQSLCDDADLLIQHVEVVQNQWVLIVCARTEITADRLAGLRRGFGAESAPPPGEDAYDLRRIRLDPDADELAVAKGTPAAKTVTVVPDRVGVEVTVQGGRGGVRMATPDAGVVRIELSFADAEKVSGVWVRQHDRDGRSLAAWFWSAGAAELHERFITYVFRPGIRSRGFAPTGKLRRGEAATTEVILETQAKGRATMHVQRAAAAGAVGALRSGQRLRTALGISQRPSPFQRLVARGGPTAERLAKSVADRVPSEVKDRLR